MLQKKVEEKLDLSVVTQYFIGRCNAKWSGYEKAGSRPLLILKSSYPRGLRLLIDLFLSG